MKSSRWILAFMLASTSIIGQRGGAPVTLPDKPTAVLMPTVSTEITGPGTWFDSSTSLPTSRDAAHYKYEVKEYFISGTANGKPYKTRIVVRKPSSAGKFSGLAMVEAMHPSGAAHMFEFTSDYTMSSFGSGCIFSVGMDGTNFTTLYSFSLTDNTGHNSDGSYPLGALALDGGILYGVTQYGGIGGAGVIYQINTNGSQFCTLAQFPRVKQGTNTTGANPAAGLIKVGDSLYGTTAGGGAYGDGSVFALDFPSPAINAAASGNQLSITWPVWAQKYVLETSASLNATNWQAVAVSSSGTNFVFNVTMQPGSAFFRLRK